jgi:hypothetical protein
MNLAVKALSPFIKKFLTREIMKEEKLRKINEWRENSITNMKA